VEVALKIFEKGMGESLTPNFRQLESKRLQRLCSQWLTVEQWNPETGEGRADFKVIACEEKHTVDLGHLRINLVIDRIDELVEDGRRIVLDYKTGAADAASWSQERLTEPQLPLYASIVLAKPDQPAVAAVAFAKVRLGECQFKGVAAESRLLPGVGGLRPPSVDPDELEELASEDDGAPDAVDVSATAIINAEGDEISTVDKWQELLDQWKERVEAIAEEIHRGEAAVRFADFKDLRYCDVLPLLRVTERKQQFEQQGAQP
jgi:exodeoxyribonuclease-5